MKNYLNKYKNKSGELTKNTFTNWNNKQISFLPFYHTACKVFRVARYEQGELDVVYENKGYNNLRDCECASFVHYNYWMEFNNKQSLTY